MILFFKQGLLQLTIRISSFFCAEVGMTMILYAKNAHELFSFEKSSFQFHGIIHFGNNSVFSTEHINSDRDRFFQ